MARLSDTQPIPTLPTAGSGSVPWGAAPSPSTPVPRRVIRRRRTWGAESRRWFAAVLVFLGVGVPLLGLSLVAAIYWQARSDQTRPVDAIVVLGTAQFNGRPGPVLRARLARTLEVYEAGSAPLVVATGGRQPGDAFTEAEASRDWLVARGVPEAAILLENEGGNSLASMRGVADLLSARGLDEVLLVSDGFHLFRLKLMARELGLRPYATAAPDSPIRPGGPGEVGYVLREAAAVVAYLFGDR